MYESRKQRDQYYQRIADAHGLPVNGRYSATARARRIVLEAMEDAADAPDVEDDEPAPLPTRPAPQSRAPRPAAPAVRSVPRPDPLAPLWSEFSWLACVHEASHAVAALACGLRVYGASVTASGYCSREHSSNPHTQAVVILAGPVGEFLLCDGPDPFEEDGSGTGDLKRLAALGLGPTAERAARDEAVRLVSVHRNAIGKVAGRLAAWGILDGDEAAGVFRLHG